MIRQPAAGLRRAALASLALVAIFVAARWGLVSWSGQVLFHLDGAEYGYFEALADVVDWTPREVAADAHMFHSVVILSRHVADKGLHGTTLLGAAALHFVLQGGAPVSFWTLKSLALAQSAVGFALWMALLSKEWRRPEPVIVFGVLFILAPTSLVKLHLLFWGTHDTAAVLHVALLLGVSGWLKRPAGIAGATGRAAVFGVVTSALCLLNFTLLLPTATLAVWLAGSSALEVLRRRGRLAAVATGVGVVLVGAGAFLGIWHASVEGSPLMQELGYQRWPLANDRVAEGMSVAAWQPVKALWPLVVSETRGVLPGLFCAVWILGAALWWASGRSAADGEPVPARSPILVYLSAHLLIAWFVIGRLPQAWPGNPPFFGDRFAAHLYPVAVAVAAAWVTSWPKAGRVVFVALLAIGLGAQATLLRGGNAGVRRGYDAAALYCELKGVACQRIPRDRYGLGGASPSFLRGMGAVTEFQTLFQLHVPNEHPAGADLTAPLGSWSRQIDLHSGDPERTSELLAGLGYASRLLDPDSRPLLAPLAHELGQDVAPLHAGFDLDPETLR